MKIVFKKNNASKIELGKDGEKLKKGVRFEYNVPSELDIIFEEMLIPLENIKTDGYEREIEHRPVRQPHVNKLKASYTGDYIKPKVVYSSEDEYYHVVQGQHLIEAIRQLINEQKIKSMIEMKCDVIKRKSTNMIMDEQNFDDKKLCFQYSYRVTDSQERNCISDTIWMIIQLADEYEEKTGKTHGVIEYIYENQYGYRKLTESTIKIYKGYGNRLKELNLMEKAQKERWGEPIIKAEIEKYKLSSSDMKELKIKLPQWAYDELIKKGFDDSEVYIDIARTPETFNARFLSRVIEEIKS